MEMANKAEERIKELEDLLQERTNDLDIRMQDLSIFEQTVS